MLLNWIRRLLHSQRYEFEERDRCIAIYYHQVRMLQQQLEIAHSRNLQNERKANILRECADNLSFELQEARDVMLFGRSTQLSSSLSSNSETIIDLQHNLQIQIDENDHLKRLLFDYEVKVKEKKAQLIAMDICLKNEDAYLKRIEKEKRQFETIAHYWRKQVRRLTHRKIFSEVVLE